MPLWAPIKTLSKFSFFICISRKKNDEVAINDFTMYLIILKWLKGQKRQKCRQKKKTRQKDKAREETVYDSVFI